jgi:transcription elongation factor Elf1
MSKYKHRFKCVYCGADIIWFISTYLFRRAVETADSCNDCGAKAENTRMVLVEKKVRASVRVSSIRKKII